MGGAVIDPLVGQELKSKYRVLRLLGRGGMGAVYLGEHLSLGRECAIKVIRNDLGIPDATFQAMVQRFRNEARIMSQLRVRGCVDLFDFDEDADGQPFIVMELLEGRSLQQHMDATGKIEWREMFRVLEEVCVPLAAAHERRIWHRDIKPDNIFLCSSGEVKLMDFGVAHVDSPEGGRMTTERNVLGTPLYMSREHVTAAMDVDGRADVYSLGAVGYTGISGKHTFEAGNQTSLLVKIATEVPIDVLTHSPELPPEAAAVIRKAMAPERDARYSTVMEFAEVLRATRATVKRAPQIGPGEQTFASLSPPAPAPSLAATRTRSTSRALAVGVLVVALAIGGVALFLFQRSHNAHNLPSAPPPAAAVTPAPAPTAPMVEPTPTKEPIKLQEITVEGKIERPKHHTARPHAKARTYNSVGSSQDIPLSDDAIGGASEK